MVRTARKRKLPESGLFQLGIVQFMPLFAGAYAGLFPILPIGGKQMFTLKKVQYLAGMSQETHCYTADLYLNGCKVAEVGNAGHGGCDDVRYVNGGARNCIDDALDKLNYTYLDDTAMGAEIRRRICKLVEFGDDGYCKNDTQHSDEKLCAEYSHVLDIKWVQHDLESICCRLVNEYLAKKELKRLLSKRVIWIFDGKVWQTNTAGNAAQRDRWVEEIERTRKEGQVILNSMPFDDALKLFNEVA